MPDPRTMLDETVTCWLGLDTLHERDEQEEAIEEMGERVAAERAVADARAREDGGTATDAPPPAAERSPEPAPERTVRRVVRRNGSSDGGDDSGSGVQDRKGGSFVVATPPKPRDAGAVAAAGRAAAADRDEGSPFLQVVDTGAYGVRLAFDCRCLESLNFRSSMPMQGMTSNETDRSKLVARPLAWVDKATGHFTNTGELEARYEFQVKAAHTAREVTQAMSTLDELPPPFNLPMPYYVSRGDVGKVTVHCETVATPRGVRCEVVIPSVRYALEWLGRVNGVCGEDYAALEAEVLKFEAEAWRTIPPTVRHRLAVWFDFAGEEQFLGYFNDSDFSRSDAGLAGLVLTTERLVYCRYHHNGAISLADGGKLVAIEEGKFATLFYKADGTRRRLVRLRNEDVDQLADLVAALECPMEMQIETAPPEGYAVESRDADLELHD